MKNKFLLIVLLLIFTRCEYNKDKLKIKNETSNKLFCETITIDKEDYNYHQNSGGAIIPAHSVGSPIVRGGENSIKSDILQNSVDGYLYIIYYFQKDQEYINKNIRTIIFDKRFKVGKYNLKELDSLGWTITYDGN
ncbi:hypothetical protein [Flavobacterium sp. GNP001]